LAELIPIYNTFEKLEEMSENENNNKSVEREIKSPAIFISKINNLFSATAERNHQRRIQEISIQENSKYNLIASLHMPI